MRKKLTSIILALAIIFTCAFTGVSEAAQVPSASSPAASVTSGSYMYYSVYNKSGYCYLSRMKISTKAKTYLLKTELWFSDVQADSGYMIVTYYYDNYYNNTAKYLCTTSGKNGQVLKTYYSS